jgi:hypothetical protein
MSATAHHDGVVARVQSDAGLASSVFELGEVPANRSTPYVVIASSMGDRSQLRFTGTKDGITTNHTLYGVGLTAAQARWVGEKITALMLDFRIPLTGRQAFRPDPWTSRPVQVDKDGPIVHPFVTISFDIHSEPI